MSRIGLAVKTILAFLGSTAILMAISFMAIMPLIYSVDIFVWRPMFGGKVPGLAMGGLALFSGLSAYWLLNSKISKLNSTKVALLCSLFVSIYTSYTSPFLGSIEYEISKVRAKSNPTELNVNLLAENTLNFGVEIEPDELDYVYRKMDKDNRLSVDASIVYGTTMSLMGSEVDIVEISHILQSAERILFSTASELDLELDPGIVAQNYLNVIKKLRKIMATRPLSEHEEKMVDEMMLSYLINKHELFAQKRDEKLLSVIEGSVGKLGVRIY